MEHRTDFVEALLAAPLGVALLAILEREQRAPESWERFPASVHPEAVEAAVEAVGRRTLGSVLELAVQTSYLHVGPWMGDAGANAADAYRHAEARRPIAQALADRFGAELHRPMDPERQEWWDSSSDSPLHGRARFREYGEVYGAGQFTWAGFWTITAPPAEVHQELIPAWELDPEPVSRWSVPVRPEARVFEVHRPEHWAALATSHPSTGREHADWELPGLNQRPHQLADLMAVRGQRAARTSIRHHVQPDWAAVAERWDAVHLSWAGFLTSEGCVTDLGDGDVTMLRYCFSERTHWLHDRFGEPAPMGPPSVQHDGTSLQVVDPRMDVARRRRDEDVLRRQFGR